MRENLLHRLSWHTAAAATVLLAIATVGFWASSAAAEQPTWANVRRPLYAVLQHWFRPVADDRTEKQGIWAFDLASREYTRRCAFYFNGKGGVIPASEGEGSYLTAFDDRLLFQSWPAYIEFDAASGRAVRRYSPLDHAQSNGFTIQGPAVSGAAASRTGLTPAVYGFLLCEYYYLNFGDIPRTCPDFVLPPYPLHDEGTLWLSRPLDADSASVSVLAQLKGRPEQSYFDLMSDFSSFDPNRNGFWLGGCTFWGSFRDLTFVPVTSGAPGLDNASKKAIPETTCGTNQGTDMLFYDPLTDSFFVNRSWWIAPFERHFLQLDQDLNIVATLGHWSGDPNGPKDPMPWTLARLPAEPPSEYVQTVPIVVHSPGKNGTFWTTDLWLFNPSSQSTTVSARRIAAPGASPSTIELAAYASVRISDVLTAVGGGPSGDGVTHDALVLTTPYRWGEQVVAASRTFTPSSDPTERAAGGTMGQAVLAVPGRTGYTNHLQDLYFDDLEAFVGRPAQLVLDRRDPARFRHNLGIVNDTADPLHLTLWWGYPEPYPSLPWPPTGAKQVVTIAPHIVQMVALEDLFPAGVQASLPAKIAVTADRAAIVWLSMVDNLTGDSTFVPYTLFFMMGGADTRAAIPVVAHLPGEKTTFWVTDLYSTFWDMNHEAQGDTPYGWEDQPHVYFHPVAPDVNCGGAASTSHDLVGVLDGVAPYPTDPGWPNRVYWRGIFPDVVHQITPCATDNNLRGALEVRTGSWMSAYTRTYTTRADGGTYGEMMPLYPEHGWPVQHFAGIEVSSRFRINLGLFNGDKDHAITHRLLLYAADGTLVAQHELTLQPWENMQDRLERMLGIAVGSLPTGSYGLTVLPLDDAAHGVEGRSWAYVSMVDNVTGDPTNWW